MKAETTKKARKARVSVKAVTTPELYSYLKRHRLCRKYLRNLREQYPEAVRYIVQSRSEQYEHIVASFTWIHTPEGSEFWRVHSNKFDKCDIKA